MGGTFLSQRNAPRLAWSFCWKEVKESLEVAPLCLFWTVWKDRNIKAFENIELSEQELKFSFLCNFFELDQRGSKG